MELPYLGKIPLQFPTALPSTQSISDYVFSLDPNSQNVQIGFIAFVSFLFLLVFGFARHHMLSWSMKGAKFGVFFGIIITLVVEAIFFTSKDFIAASLVNNKIIPQPIQTFFLSQSTQLTNVIELNKQTLGIKTEIPVLSQQPSVNTFLNGFEHLSDIDKDNLRRKLCMPE